MKVSQTAFSSPLFLENQGNGLGLLSLTRGTILRSIRWTQSQWPVEEYSSILNLGIINNKYILHQNQVPILSTMCRSKTALSMTPLVSVLSMLLEITM